MESRIINFLITLFLGCFGVHKFIQKKFFVGILYLITLGGFFIFWIIDTILAFIRIFSPEFGVKKPKNVLIKTYTCDIVGTFANCALSEYEDTRPDQITEMKDDEPVDLQFFKYKGEPAFYVCRSRNGCDIGCLPAFLSKEIVENYPDTYYNYSVHTLERKIDDYRNQTFRILVEVYKN